jgi:hypothetical protein
VSDVTIRSEPAASAALLGEGGRVADFVELLKPRVM